jgi:hypothetical protein
VGVVPKLKFWSSLPLTLTIQYKGNSGMYAEYTIYRGAGGRNNAFEKRQIWLISARNQPNLQDL